MESDFYIIDSSVKLFKVLFVQNIHQKYKVLIQIIMEEDFSIHLLNLTAENNINENLVSEFLYLK